MDNKDVSYITFESVITRMERTIERLWILSIILIILFVGSNIAWIYYESQFVDTIETTTIEATQDGEGINIVSGEGVEYGAESKDN